jgi:hypothetical protein
MKGYRTKKIALPGGRVIEIVYFADGPELPGEPPATDPGAGGPGARCDDDDAPATSDDPMLHVCPACESDLVYPVSWEERAGDAWHIDRRCPNCEWRHSGEFGQDAVELFDDVLNDGTGELLLALRGFARENMEADVERLIEALRLDLIEPMDF